MISVDTTAEGLDNDSWKEVLPLLKLLKVEL